MKVFEYNARSLMTLGLTTEQAQGTWAISSEQIFSVALSLQKYIPIEVDDLLCSLLFGCGRWCHGRGSQAARDISDYPAVTQRGFPPHPRQKRRFLRDPAACRNEGRTYTLGFAALLRVEYLLL